MNVVRNAVLARRRRRQATVLSLVGLAVLGLGLYLNFQGQPLAAYTALIVGSIASWTGIALADKWVRPPSPDEALAGGLKGAGRAFRLYHWVLPAEHVLAAPWGLTLMLVSTVDGRVTIADGRWRESRPLWRRLLTIGRRPLGNPRSLARLESDSLRAALVAQDPELADVAIDAVVVFVRPGVVVDGRDDKLPALLPGDLRGWLRDQKRRPTLTPPARRRIDQALDELVRQRLGS